MARIPVPTSNPQLPRQIYNADQFGAAQGRALQGLGGSVRELGGALTERKRRREEEKAKDEISQINRELAKAKADLLIGLREEAENADPSDTGVEERFNRRVQDRLDAISNLATTDRAREFYRDQSSTAVAGFRVDSDKVQADLAGRRRAIEYQDSADALTSTIVSNPDSFKEALEQSESTLSALLTPQEKDKAMPFEQSRLARARVEGLIANDRAQEARNELMRGDLDQYIDGELKAQLLRSAETKIKADKDYALALARLEFQDDLGQIALTGQTGRWTEDRARALGDNPVQSEQLARQFRTAVAVGSAANSMLDTPLQDDLKRVSSMADNLRSAEDFQVEEARTSAAAQALQNKITALQKDPANYVIKANPAVKNAFDAFSSNPTAETFQRYYSASVAEQGRINPDAPPAALPTAMVDQIGAQLDRTGEDGGAENATSVLRQWQDMTGRAWPEVARDLYAGKALSPIQYVAANVSMGRHPSLAAQLIKADAMDETELHKLAGGGSARSDAREDAIRALEPMRATLALQPGGLDIYNAQVDSLTRLTLWKQAQGEKVNSGDVKKYAKQMFLEEYNFRGSLRVPNTQDARSVFSGSTSLLQNIETLNIVVPPGFDDYPLRVRANGMWVTASDEKGAKLIDDIGRPVIERLPDGSQRQVYRTWDELSAAARKADLEQRQRFMDNPPLSVR